MEVAELDAINYNYVCTHPEIIRLLKKSEGISDMLNLKPKEILLRWVNYLINRVKGDIQIENLGSDMSDGKALLYICLHTSPKAEEAKLKEALLITDSKERVKFGLDMSAKISVVKHATAEDFYSGNELKITGFLAAYFKTNSGVHMPSENEISKLYDELMSLRRRIEDFEQSKLAKEQHISYLKKEISDLELRERRAIEDEERFIKDISKAEEKHKEDLDGYELRLNEMRMAIQKLDKSIAEKENEYEVVKNEKVTTEKECANTQKDMKSLIFNLKGQIEHLKQTEESLNSLINGKGDDLAELEAKKTALAETAAKKRNAIKKHVDELHKLHVTEYSDATGKEGLCKSFSNEEIEALHLLLKEQDFVLQMLSEQKERSKTAFEKSKMEETRKLLELQKSIADYLGDGSGDVLSAEDGIANIQKLLQLMILKSKKQAEQIGVLEVAIEKKNQLNNIMTEKVRDIAEQNLKSSSRHSKSKK